MNAIGDKKATIGVTNGNFDCTAFIALPARNLGHLPHEKGSIVIMKTFKRLIVILLIIFANLALASPMHSDADALIDVLSDASCTSWCFMGIQPGVTTQTQVRSILNTAGISVSVWAGIQNNDEPNGLYWWDINDDTPFVMPSTQPSVQASFANGVVTQLIIPLNIPIPILLEAFGNPTAINKTDNEFYYILYPSEGLVFQVSALVDAEKTNGVFLATPALIEENFVEVSLDTPIGNCTEPATLCNIQLASASTITPDPPTQSHISSVAWSPDGTHIAEGYTNGTVLIRNASTNQVIHTLSGHTDAVLGVAWSPVLNDHRLASAGLDRSVRIWNTDTGALLHTLTGHETLVLNVLWSLDATRVISTPLSDGSPTNARVWDTSTGNQIASISIGDTSDLQWNSNGTQLAITTLMGLDVLNPNLGLVRRLTQSELGGLGFNPTKVTWHPNDQWVGTGALNGTLRIWDTATGQILLTIPGESVTQLNAPFPTYILDLAFNADGSQITGLRADGKLRTWNASTGELVRETQLTVNGIIYSAAFSPDKTRIAYGDASGTTLIAPTISASASLTPDPPTQSHISSVAWSPLNAAQVARSFQNGTVEVVNIETQQVLFTYTGTSPANAVAWSPIEANKLLVAVGTSVILFDVSTQQPILTLHGTRFSATDRDEYGMFEAVRLVDWNPDGSQFAALSHIGVFRIWDAATGQLVLDSGLDQSAAIAWKPSGDVIAGTIALSVVLADPQTGNYVQFSDRPLGNFLQTIDWSANGAYFAIGSVEGEVGIWDAVTEQNLHFFQTTDNFISLVKFNPNSTRLAAASSDGSVRVWDSATGQLLQTFQEANPVYAVDWSPDGTQLAYGGADGTVEIVGVPTANATPTPTAASASTTTPHYIYSVAWSPDGSTIAVGGGGVNCAIGGDHSLQIVDSITGLPLDELEGHACEVLSVTWSSDSSRLATTSADGTIRVWSMSDRQALWISETYAPGRSFSDWSSDGTKLATIAAGDPSVEIIDSTNGQTLFFVQCNGCGPIKARWNPAISDQLAIGGMDGGLYIVDVATQQITKTFGTHSGFVTDIAWNLNGTKLVSAGGQGDNTLRVWEVATGRQLLELSAHTEAIRSVSWHDERIVSVGRDSTLRIWDANTGQQLAIIEDIGTTVYSVDWSPDGTQLAYGGADGTVEIVDVPTVNATLAQVTELAWSAQGERLAVDFEDGVIQIQDGASGDLLLQFEAHLDFVASLEWSFDASQLVSAGGDGVVSVWNTDSGERLNSFGNHAGIATIATWSRSQPGQIISVGEYGDSENHNFYTWDVVTGERLSAAMLPTVSDFAWSADNEFLALSGLGGSVGVLDGSSLTLVANITIPADGADPIASFTFSAHDRYIATGSADGRIYIWDFTSEQREFLPGIAALRGSINFSYGSPDRFSRTAVADLHFSANESTMSSISGEGRLKAWDTATWSTLLDIILVEGAAFGYQAKFSPDGTQLAYGGADGAVEIVDVPTTTPDAHDG